MKTLLNLLLVTLLCMSCSKEEINLSNSDEYTLDLKSSITSDTLQNVMSRLRCLPLSRNEDALLNDLYVDTCKKILEPFIEDGKEIREQIIWQTDSLKMLGYDIEIDADIEYVRNLTEDELATLSFIVYNVNTVDNQLLESARYAQTLEDSPFGDPMVYDKGSQERLLSCLSAAVGLTTLKELGVSGVITATTVRKALIAIGKRYLGYIGVALMIYDFTVCMGD